MAASDAGPATEEAIRSTRLRQAFASFPSGVVALCALGADTRPLGMSVSAFMPMSLAPPLVSVGIQLTSTTWPRLRRAPTIGVSVLAHTHNDAARQLSLKDVDRFAGLDWDATPDGAVLLRGAPLAVRTRLVDELPAGDHIVALLEIVAIQATSDVEPLVFHGSTFRSLREPHR